MNNFNFLSLINPQIAKAKDVGKEFLNEKYFIEIPAFFGYDTVLSCSLYLYINDKLVPTHPGNELYELINDMQEKITCILKGSDKYKLGEDYFVSESFFEYCLQYFDDMNNSSTNITSSDSSDSSNSDSIDDTSDGSSTNFPPIIEYDDNTYYIIVGPRIITEINNQLYGEDVVNEHRQDTLDELSGSTLISEEDYASYEEMFKAKYVLPDYINYYSNNTVAQNTNAWYDLSGTNNKDVANIDYFYYKNQDMIFSEDELRNLVGTFFTIILTHAVAQNYYTNINNQIYNLVMNYYKNNATDTASQAINLILGTMFTTQQQTVNCGCDAQQASNINTSTCLENYQNAMAEYLKKMLGDTQYYYDWFFIPIDGKCPMSNDVMIDLLITLLSLFLQLDLNLSFTNESNHCMCPSVNVDESACNRAIIESYIKVLRWVKNNDIDANANKIKIYGTQFGELLPKLVF